jgi:predicted dehydrogenase
MQADLRFDDGRTARITCSLASACPLWLSLRVAGKRGEMRVLNPLVPQIYHRLRLITPRGTSSERLQGEVTYVAQLRAFAKTVAGKATMSSDGPDGVANMRVVDRIYAAAGLRPRGSMAT